MAKEIDVFELRERVKVAVLDVIMKDDGSFIKALTTGEALDTLFDTALENAISEYMDEE